MEEHLSHHSKQSCQYFAQLHQHSQLLPVQGSDQLLMLPEVHPRFLITENKFNTFSQRITMNSNMLHISHSSLTHYIGKFQSSCYCELKKTVDVSDSCIPSKQTKIGYNWPNVHKIEYLNHRLGSRSQHLSSLDE